MSDMNFFDYINEDTNINKTPLAERMKPKKLDDFFGQEEILNKDSILRKLIENDSLTNCIFYGPSGTGKTSLSRIISQNTKSEFIKINAVSSGIKDIREVVEIANEKSKLAISTTVFIDEIHRFNKTQQDALLPYVEDGTISLIGATTQNPYFEVNSALISRSMIFELKSLDEIAIKLIIENAIINDKVLQDYKIEFNDKSLEILIKSSAGDARRALNILEILFKISKNKNNIIKIYEKDINELIRITPVLYDKGGQYHYDTISAFIKSIRGSNPDAAIYYLAQMLISGEDPKFIARRLIILASEDIGLANNEALIMANEAFRAVERVGMPEARIILAHITIFLSLSEKSNSSYLAINKAYEYIKNNGTKRVPEHLEDSTKKRLKSNNSNYLYPHEYENAYIEQKYLPENIKEKFYFAKNSKNEILLNKIDSDKKKGGSI